MIILSSFLPERRNPLRAAKRRGERIPYRGIKRPDKRFLASGQGKLSFLPLQIGPNWAHFYRIEGSRTLFSWKPKWLAAKSIALNESQAFLMVSY